MSRRVLVVDDEKLIVKGIRFSLEQDDMEVDCAYDGEEALEKARTKEYDNRNTGKFSDLLTHFQCSDYHAHCQGRRHG